MEHFDIVLALARMAINGDQERVRSYMTKLRDALSESDPLQAEKLTRLLNRKTERQQFAPVALNRMRNSREANENLLQGEKLSKSTLLPADKETGAPLARVIFPESQVDPIPIFDHELKTAIEDLLCEWDRIESLVEIRVRPNTRCLIYGQPGVGKTLLARSVAHTLGLPLVEARLDGLVSSFLGTTARNIGALFDFANRYKCVLFLDEFDAIAKARDDTHEIGEIKRVVNTLLQSLDARGSHQFTLAATNHEHLLDYAVWRRFEARIHIPPPNEIARKSMLTTFLEPIALPATETKMLVWLTEGMSGADLETMVVGAKRYYALHGLTEINGESRQHKMQDFLLDALKRQTTLNPKLFDVRRHNLLLGAIEELSNALNKEAGLTQKEVAKLLNVSQSTVSRYLKPNSKEKVD